MSKRYTNYEEADAARHELLAEKGLTLEDEVVTVKRYGPKRSNEGQCFKVKIKEKKLKELKKGKKD